MQDFIVTVDFHYHSEGIGSIAVLVAGANRAEAEDRAFEAYLEDGVAEVRALTVEQYEAQVGPFRAEQFMRLN